MKLRRFTVALALVALVAAVTTATSVARSTSANRLAGLPNTCHTFGKGKYVIASDLPLQGSLRPLAVQIVAAIRLELKQMNFKIGDKTITYASCDDSTAAKGSWDSQTCTNNANGYKTVKNFLGLIGTFNSGCAEIIAPILNRAPGGGIAMVSPANTYVGLTKPSGVPGEPNKYFPSGKRNYARVAVPDNFQGAADATFLQSKGIKSVYVLNDGEAYGSRYREQLRQRRQGTRHHGARQRQVGRQPARLPVAVPGDRRQEPAGDLPRRPDLAPRRPADQGQGQGARRQQQGHAARP